MKNFNRRRFLSLVAVLPGGAAILAACGDTTNQPNPTSAAGAAAVPTPASSITTTAAMTGNSTTAASMTTAAPAMTTAVATTAAPQPAIKLPNKGPAPDFNNTNWINSQPLNLASLRGQVFMVEFWTFGCVNCQNVMPSLKQMYADYSDKGFTIVSFHDPEFDYEKKWENVQEAVKQRDIKYPVAQDNDFVTWGKYKVNAWPTWFLVDKKGNIRYQHIGEGAYDETRTAIETLLAEA